MTSKEHEKAGYITLKEAGERFGYSADYIGQLIRKGKLEGKQVYANVAWMTTPEAVEEYLAKEKRTGKGEKEKIQWTRERFTQALFDKEGSRVLAWILYVMLGILVLMLLAVFYFLAVQSDRRMQERARERLIEKVPDISAIVERGPAFSAEILPGGLHFSSLTP